MGVFLFRFLMVERKGLTRGHALKGIDDADGDKWCTLYCWSPPQRFSSSEELQENKCASAQRRVDLRLDEEDGQVAARLVNSPQIRYRDGIVSSFIKIPIVNVVKYICTKVRHELNSLFR